MMVDGWMINYAGLYIGDVNHPLLRESISTEGFEHGLFSLKDE